MAFTLAFLLTHIFTQPEGTQQPYNMLTTSHLHRYTTEHKNANNTYLVRGRGSQQPATDTENRHRKNSVTLMFTRSNTNTVCLFQLAEYSACSSQTQYPSHSTLSDSTPAIQQSTVHSHLYAQQTLPHATFTHNNQIHTTHNVHSDTHFTLPNTQVYTHDIHSQEVASNKQNLTFFPLFINFFHISFHTVKYICPNLSKFVYFSNF